MHAGPNVDWGLINRVAPLGPLVIFSLMNARRLIPFAAVAVAALVGAAIASQSATTAGFIDNLDLPARMSSLATKAPVLSLARVEGDVVVGIGQRGHILRSTDNGQSWQQVASPVSSDLVIVRFPAPNVGVIVGHDGVILRSTDGGQQWSRVLDGRTLPAMLVKHYEELQASGATTERLEQVLNEVRMYEQDGMTPPFLSLHFKNAQEGWAAGQFGLLLHTTDGGASWTPRMEHADNPDGYAIHDFSDTGNGLFVAGELGLLLKYDPATQKFERLQSEYPGTWFGIMGQGDTVVAYGLRGNVYRSLDAGQNWQKLDVGTQRSLNKGLMLPDGRAVLFNDQGKAFWGKDQFEPLALAGTQGTVYDALTTSGGDLILAGPRGLSRSEGGALKP